MKISKPTSFSVYRHNVENDGSKNFAEFLENNPGYRMEVGSERTDTRDTSGADRIAEKN